MRISDWSSDVCSSDLLAQEILEHRLVELARHAGKGGQVGDAAVDQPLADAETQLGRELVEGRSFDELIEYLIDPARFDEGGHRQPRSAARRAGQQCVRRVRPRWPPDPERDNNK